MPRTNTDTLTGTEATVPVAALLTQGNVRRDVGDVSDLAASIEAVGLLQPIRVRFAPEAWGEEDTGPTVVEVVAGHRRLAAARKLGWKSVPVVWAPSAAGDPSAEAKASKVAEQLVENLQREDLDPIEEADGLARLVELLGSQGAAAEAIGRSKGHVSKRLRIASLPDEARELVRTGDLTAQDAYELAKADPDRAGAVAQEVAKRIESGVNPATARARIDEAVREAERDREDRKAARAVAKQDHRQGVAVVALPDLDQYAKLQTGKAEARPAEGWDGLAVDLDEHEGEPCHVLVVGHHRTWDAEPTERPYCIDPARHDPDGESTVKVITTRDEAEDERRREEARRERSEREERAQAFAARAAELAGDLTDRYGVLRALSIATLGDLYAETGPVDQELLVVLEAVGVDLPEDTRAQAWDPLPDDLRQAVEEAITGKTTSNAQLYRAAALARLRDTFGSVVYWPGESAGPVAEAIAESLGTTTNALTGKETE